MDIPGPVSERIAETQLDVPFFVDVLTLAQPVHAPENVAARSVEQVVNMQGAIAEQQVDDPMPQAALQLRLLRARERVLQELAAAEEEVEEKVNTGPFEFDRFEHSGLRPMRPTHMGGRCNRGVGVHVRSRRAGTQPPSIGVSTVVTVLHVVMMREEFPDGNMVDVGGAILALSTTQRSQAFFL